MIVAVLVLTLASALAEHPGAYSSPQYAKKMYPKYAADVLPREDEAQFKSEVEVAVRNDTGSASRSFILDTASSFLTGTGGQVVSSLAKDFIARSVGSSQVLSLNLTNLVILVVLKALILAAGFFGAGTWKGHHYGRSLDENSNVSYISQEEILLYLSYLSGQQSKNYGCLYRLSCQRPKQAGLYSSGAEILLQGAKLMQGNSIDLEEYEAVSRGVKQAGEWGSSGAPCNARYSCGDEQDKK